MYTKTLLVVHLIALAFLASTLRPLVRVAEQRVALFIVVSKTLGSFVKLHFDLMLAAINYFGTCVEFVCTKDMPLWYEALYLGYTQTMVLRSNWLHQFRWIYLPFWQLFYAAFNFLFPQCTEWWHQNRVVPLNNEHGAQNNAVISSNQLNMESNLTNNISNGTIAVLKGKRTVMAITLLFTIISLAYYLTFTAALLSSVPYKRDIPCTGTIEGYRCLLNEGGCPPNGSTEGTYWSDCDLFMPWLSGKELGCRRRVYSAVSTCFTFGTINYGSKYLCCPDSSE